jgi:hypothetical protein
MLRDHEFGHVSVAEAQCPGHDWLHAFALIALVEMAEYCLSTARGPQQAFGPADLDARGGAPCGDPASW